MLPYINFDTNYFIPQYFKYNYLIVGRIEMVPLQTIWNYKYKPTHQSPIIDCDDPQHSQR